MYKKIIVTVLFISISCYSTAQKNINNYKYIIVPRIYDFSSSEDQYQLNSLTKFLFNKYGYEAYFMDEDFPKDLRNDRCLALTSVVSKAKGGLLKTKLVIALKDCFGNIVMTSQIGESRLKAFEKSYNQALRAAFETFQTINYKYVPEETTKETAEQASKQSMANEMANVAISTESVETEQEILKSLATDIYYAQAIENGFQLVNSEPKIVMILWATAAKNVFLVKDKSAVVFKEDGLWYYSENDGKLGEKQLLNIKF